MRQAAVVVPAAVIELDEADVALRQSPREEAVRGERPGPAGLLAVEFERLVGFTRDVGEVGDARLHAVGHLVLGDPRLDLGVSGLGEGGGVEVGEGVEHRPAAAAVDPGRVGEIEHRVLPAAEADALMPARQEPRAPQPGEQPLARLALARRRVEDDEGGQVRVLAAEAVVDPRPRARPARQLAAGLHERDRRVVVDRLGVGRADHAEVVDDLPRVREHVADLDPALAARPERVAARRDRQSALRGDHSRDALSAEDRFRDLLARPVG